MIEKDGQELIFTTTDLDIQIKTHASLGVGPDQLKATIPSAKFISILNALPKSDKNLSVETEGKKVILLADTSRFTLAQLNADEYPSLPAITEGRKFSLPASAIKYLLQMVHFAMAQQDIRYYLNGLLLVVEKTKFARLQRMDTAWHAVMPIAKSASMNPSMLFCRAKLFCN